MCTLDKSRSLSSTWKPAGSAANRQSDSEREQSPPIKVVSRRLDNRGNRENNDEVGREMRRGWDERKPRQKETETRRDRDNTRRRATRQDPANKSKRCHQPTMKPDREQRAEFQVNVIELISLWENGETAWWIQSFFPTLLKFQNLGRTTRSPRIYV